jgi:ribulose-phosphate 3-epimerase
MTVLRDTPQLSVGVLAGDLLNMGRDLDALGRAGVELIHVDVMDGVFCPTITAGPSFVRAIPDTFVKDVHLMIDEPIDKLGQFVAAGAGIVTVHVESTRHPHRALQSLDGTGVARGVALNPGTPLSTVEPLLDDIDLLLLLAVNPGWGGQAFLPSTASRLIEARDLIGDRPIAVGVDGGITRANFEDVASLGANIVVTGSAVFEGGNPAGTADAMRRSLEAVGASVSGASAA